MMKDSDNSNGALQVVDYYHDSNDMLQGNMINN